MTKSFLNKAHFDFVTFALDSLMSSDNLKIFTESDFEDEVEVGWGFSGLVLKSRHRPTNRLLARKIIHQTPRKRRELFEPRPEIEYYQRIVRSGGAQNVVKCIGLLPDGQRGHIHGGLVFEFMDLGSLADSLQRKKHVPLPEPIILRIAQSILQACHQLEALGIVHRDIKPSNILINSAGEVKLCDFGEACFAWESLDPRSKYAKMATGSTAYMAPERLACREHSHPADLWSLGLVLLELTCQNFPFSTTTTTTTTTTIERDDSFNLDPHHHNLTLSPASSMDSVASFEGDCSIVELWESVMEDSQPLPKVAQPEYSETLARIVEFCLRKDYSARPSAKWLLKKFSHFLEKNQATPKDFVSYFSD